MSKRKGIRKRWWFLGGALGLVLLIGVAGAAANKKEAPSPGAGRLTAAQPKLVFAYFYYWYDLPNGTHSTALTDRPADVASYKNVGWFKRQFTDMEEAGIDVALAVYWGPEEPSSDVGLVNMVQAATELRAEGRRPPKIGLFLDTGLIGRWPTGQRDLRDEENAARVYGLVRKFYETVPRDQWGIVEGKPVFWLWGSWLGIRFEQDFFDYVYGQFQQDMGARPYIVADNSWRYEIGAGLIGGTSVDRTKPISVDDFYSWGASLEGYRDEGGNIAQIGPGYDERQLKGSPDRTGRYRPREGGAFYRASWEAAIASGKRFVAIETWNEFHEAAEIAESVEYGRQYIELTKTMAARFKGGK